MKADVTTRGCILLIEDDRRLVRALTRGLTEEGFDVQAAFRGDSGLDRLKAGGVALCRLDHGLPEADGFDVLGKARAAGIRIPIIMLTAQDGVSHRVQGLNLGADDYIAKPFAFEELLARIRSVLRRVAPPAAPTLTFRSLVLDTQMQRVTCAGRTLEIPAKQRLLLETLMRHPREVLSRERLLREVWGYEFDPGTNIVDVHIAALRQKIDAGPGASMIRTVRGVGYGLDSSDADPQP